VTDEEPETEAALEPVDPANIDWPPQIVYSSPLPGDEVTLDGAITVLFDQPMDQESVESATVVIQQSEFMTETVDTTPVDGVFTWPEADTLIFTPRSTLERQQHYVMRIEPEAAGSNGEPIGRPVELEFQTVGFLEVSNIVPADGTEGVATDAAITVLFNRPVVPLVTTGNQESLPDILTIDPPVEGSGEWTSTSIYRFTADGGFAGATDYTITIPAGLEDVTGAVLAEDVVSRFRTLSPSVVETRPQSGDTDVVPTRPMTITFSMPMDEASTIAATSLSPAVPLSYEWQDDGRTLVVQPDQMLELGTRYTLTVASSALAASGGASLDRETNVIFTTVPLPRVLTTYPSDGSLADRFQYGVNIEFSGPMNPDTIDERIIIDPEPTRVVYNLSEGGRYTYLGFELERNSNYTITVPGDVADPYGNTLGEDYVFSFDTSGFSPLASMNLPGPVAQLSTDHPSDVTIIYRNVSQIDAALYDAGLPSALLGAPWQLNEFQPERGLLRTWSLPVENVQDEAGTLVLSLADGGVLPTGIYLLEISAPEVDANSVYWQRQQALLVVSDTNLVIKQMPSEVRVWATDLASGLPAAGRELTLYDNFGSEVGVATTDAEGLANFNYQPIETYMMNMTVVSNTPGESGFGAANSEWNTGVSPWQYNVNYTTSLEAPEFAYIYTDRPIYRPGDTVYFKGILREADYGRYNLPERESVTVKVEYISFFEPSEDLGIEQELTLDEFGAFDGEFTVPASAGLGLYRIYLDSPDFIDFASREFQVAEYRTPEFQVMVTPAQEEAFRGDTVDVVVEARYFFGAPAGDLPVNWTIYQQPYTLPWTGPYYQFTDDDAFYYFYEPTYVGFYGEFLTSGTGRTDAEGRFTLTLPADLLDEVEAGSRLITIDAQISDLSEFPVAAQGTVVLHDGEVYVGIRGEDSLPVAGVEAGVELITVDWDSEIVPNSDVEVVFYERTYELIRESQFGYIQSVYEPIDTEVARTTVTTNDDGEAVATFVPEIGGTYRAVATVADSAGRQQRSSTFFWVVDENFAGWRTDPRERRMDLAPDKPEYQVGETARILVQSPFTGPATAWVTIERGNLLDQRVTTLNSASEVVDIPITPDMAPNAYVTIVVVKGVDETNEFADIRMGVVELIVNPEQLLLNVELTPRADVLQPGETVTYDIRATDYAGNGVEASLSLALVDLAVLTLLPDNAPEIGTAFYDRQPLRSMTGSGLFVSGEGLEVEVPLEQGGGFGGGGDGAASPSLALAEEDDVRRDFPDTAFWEANVITDASGQATVDIPLPDSTTTWRLSSKGVTRDTLVGQNSVDIIATLPLLIRPVTPRFFTVDDVAQIGAIINNNTDAGFDVTVSLEAEGVTLSGDAEQQITVPANGQQLVRWTVTAEDLAAASLTFRAEGGGYSDATRPTFGFGPDQLIPIYRYDARDIVGTSGVLEEAGRRVEAIVLPENLDPSRGTVEMRLEPSLAATIFTALETVDEYDLESACAHGVVHALLVNSAAALAFQEAGLEDAGLDAQLDELVPQAIARLAQLQKPSGGWSYCESTEVDAYLTAYILFGLSKAQEAGYSSDPVDVRAALRVLNIVPAQRLTSRYAVNRQAFFLYVLSAWGDADVEDMDELVTEHQDLMDPYAKAYLALAYEMAGDGDNENVAALLADLTGTAIVSATGAHWEDAVQDYANLATDIRGTAVVIDALANLDPENPLAPQAVRWLMSTRQAFVWPTEFETVWSTLALTDWVAATGELDAEYDYSVGINGTVLNSGQFDETNVTTAVQESVEMSRLPENTTNYIDYVHGEGPGRLYYTTHLDAYLAAESVQPVSRGVQVERVYFDAACDPLEETCEPITEIEAGQQVRVQLTIIAPNDLTYVVVEDPIPAGTEALNPALQTTGIGFDPTITPEEEGTPYGYWGWWFFNDVQFEDEKVVFTSNFLPAGSYQYTYYLQAAIPGDYQVMPAVAFEEFFPEVFGRSNGMLFRIVE
jgi:uncharacterized protein YfaS (alpha-2-macroglobulin family)